MWPFVCTPYECHLHLVMCVHIMYIHMYAVYLHIVCVYVLLLLILSSQSYEIWDPNSITVESNIPAMMEHLSEREYVFNLSEMAHVYCMSVFPQKNSDRVLDSNFNLF